MTRMGRVEMWRGYCRPDISVFRLFRLAVPYWSWPWPRFHIPLIEPDWRLSQAVDLIC